MTAHRLSTNPIHLGLGATAEVEPGITGVEWYEAYVKRHEDDGAEARIVAQHSFTESWPMWEMHPRGAEVVLCTSGAMVLHQQFPDGREAETRLGAGEYAINPPGVWHTADVEGEAQAIFITAGLGTEHRPR